MSSQSFVEDSNILYFLLGKKLGFSIVFWDFHVIWDFPLYFGIFILYFNIHYILGFPFHLGFLLYFEIFLTFWEFPCMGKCMLFLEILGV